MTRLTPQVAYKSTATFLMLLCIQTLTWAQDAAGESSTSHVTKTTTTTTWYAEPWVWVVGVAVLILLLVALLKGNSSGASRTDKVTVTKTTSSDV